MKKLGSVLILEINVEGPIFGQERRYLITLFQFYEEMNQSNCVGFTGYHLAGEEDYKIVVVRIEFMGLK